MKIKHLSIINNYLTAVYFTPCVGWKYIIFLQDGNLFQPEDSYQSAEEAHEITKNIIHLVVACDRESTASR